MRLRNKKTGEIIDLQEIIHQKYQEHDYNSLAELNEEWEDYEDRPYIIDMWEDGCICDAKFGVELEGIERAKECGLYFETEEEAKKAVEKLKALTKLCKKGFEFNGVEMFGGGLIRIEASIPINEKTTLQERSDITDSLYLLFGGEE